MKNTHFLRPAVLKRGLLLVAVCAGLMTESAHATRVQFQTVMGDFEVNLYDKGTPKTVENFLKYVNAGAYTNTVIHRTLPSFVVQGGGFKYDGIKLPVVAIPQNAAVVNEPVYSNVRGTIAMAKTNDPNSATNQWFFNLADNSKSLDIKSNSGGFTVFGEVTGNGMAIIDAMSKLVTTSEFPLLNYTATDLANNVVPTPQNLVLIKAVVVLDASPDTAANLNPAKNTLVTQTESSGGSGGGGGAFGGWLSLVLLLSIAGFTRRRP